MIWLLQTLDVLQYSHLGAPLWPQWHCDFGRGLFRADENIQFQPKVMICSKGSFSLKEALQTLAVSSVAVHGCWGIFCFFAAFRVKLALCHSISGIMLWPNRHVILNAVLNTYCSSGGLFLKCRAWKGARRDQHCWQGHYPAPVCCHAGSPWCLWICILCSNP